VIKSSKINSIIRYGTDTFKKPLILQFVTPQVTYIKVPIGGVIFPIDMLNTQIMPKCIKSIPYEEAMGAKIGINITAAAFPSTNMPTKIRKMFTRIR